VGRRRWVFILVLVGLSGALALAWPGLACDS
jgi:hypothetical protein